MRGVVAAGHPLTAEAGAEVLRAGGNAVDAAVAAMAMSFVTEPALTGPGAGGFMLLHTADGEDHLLDFFVTAPGLGPRAPEPGELTPVRVTFGEGAIQVFNIGPPSCGVYGTPAGMHEAVSRFGTLDLSALVAGAVAAARDGVVVMPMQAHLFRILDPVLSASAESRALYHPAGRVLETGDLLRQPELGDLLERLGGEGPAFLYSGDVAAAISDLVLERGGALTREDLAGYRVVERAPARVAYSGREVLTNPPPSSGGILIAYSLHLLERLGRAVDARAIVEVMDATNRARTEDFTAGLRAEGYLERFLAADALETAAGAIGSRLGSTTHISVLDDEGACATVTASNGSSSGVLVPGAGMHLNNMLGEEDLNPFGFGRYPPGQRVASMMAPTVVLRDGAPEIALGSAGSNRIRSAILQTIVGVVERGEDLHSAVVAPRLHFEAGVVHAEPGVDEAALRSMEGEGYAVQRWPDRNLFFGGVQAAGRDPATGELRGEGDPRRGGVAVLVR